MKTVIRKQYRAQLQEIPEEQALSAFALCREQAAGLIRQGGAMTAAMYRYGRQLFLYMEYLDEELSPEVLFPGLQDCLSPWPQKDGTAKWVDMYPVFWHDEPRGEEDWKREKTPGERRGRIALLRHENMFEYEYQYFKL